jgi:hypothetical protein
VCFLSDFDFSNEYSSSSEDDKKTKCKKCDFISLCLMGKFSRNISDSDSDSNVGEDLSFESLSLKFSELENALYNQDKLLSLSFS